MIEPFGQILQASDQKPIELIELEKLLQSVDLRSLFVPIFTPERFAELVGVPLGVLQGHMRRNYIPVVRFGKYNFINVPLLTQQLLNNQKGNIK